MIRIKRAYEPPESDDGCRVLVDRVWPRGVTRAGLHLDAWMRELAPSTALRRWFGHDPARWEEFQARYWRELEERPEEVARLLDLCREQTVTLAYGARDTEHNNAVALRAYLERRLADGDDMAGEYASPACLMHEIDPAWVWAEDPTTGGAETLPPPKKRRGAKRGR